MTTRYPKRVLIETPDGGGEALKREAGDAWLISIPTGDLRFYGTASEMEAEVRSWAGYPRDEITFSRAGR